MFTKAFAATLTFAVVVLTACSSNDLPSAPLAPALAKGADAGGTVGTPATPCVQIVHQEQQDAINLAGKDLSKPIAIPLSYTLTSCSSGSQSFTVTFTDNDHLPVDQPPSFAGPCMLPAFSSGTLSLKAGETRSFKTDSPSITPLATLPYPYIQGCYIQHIFKLTVRDGAGNVLATDWQINAVQSRI